MPTTVMAAVVPLADNSTAKPQFPRRICFSLAAYAKTMISDLRTSDIPIADGLSDSDLSRIELTYGFKFPSDLRSIIQEGLPVAPEFPNWRSSSHEQLQLLLSLPIRGLLNEVSKGTFWPKSWRSKPSDPNDAIMLARKTLESAPVLVPIYRHFYVPSIPNLAGNPVFYIRGSDVRSAGLDITGFFQQEVFRTRSCHRILPAWAAKEARKIPTWTDLVVESESGGGGMRIELTKFSKVLESRLREGGWAEEDVSEMLVMRMDGVDHLNGLPMKDRNSVTRHISLLGLVLLRAGWSWNEVVYMGSGGGAACGGRRIEEEDGVMWQVGDKEITLDFNLSRGVCSIEEELENLESIYDTVLVF